MGQRVTTVYDAAGQAIAAVDPLKLGTQQRVRLGRATHRRRRRPRLPRHHGLRRRRPGAGRQSTRWASAPCTAYDLAGRMTATINPMGQRTTTVYDAAGQPVIFSNPGVYAAGVFPYAAPGRALPLALPAGLGSWQGAGVGLFLTSATATSTTPPAARSPCRPQRPPHHHRLRRRRPDRAARRSADATHHLRLRLGRPAASGDRRPRRARHQPVRRRRPAASAASTSAGRAAPTPTTSPPGACWPPTPPAA